MRLSLEVRIRNNGDLFSQWVSPEFDTEDPSTWPGEIEPTAEFLNVPSDAEVKFSLIGDRSIGDESWSEEFKINGYQGTTPSLSFNNKGIFESKGKSWTRFFEASSPSTFIRLGRASGYDRQGKKLYAGVLAVPVSVTDGSGRGLLYLKMLGEVLAVNPGLAMPDDDRMVMPRLFEIVFPEFKNGDTDVSSELMQYRVLKHDLDVLVLGVAPLLSAIERHPITSLLRTERLVQLRSVRRVSRRQLMAIRARGFDDCDVSAEACVVTEGVLAEGYDTIANRSIRTFLDDAVNELNSLKRRFEQQWRIYDKEKSERPRLVGQRYSQRMKLLEAIVQEITGIVNRLGRYMKQSEMWRSLAGGVNVLDPRVCRRDFMASGTYLRVYGVLWRHYMRRHWLKSSDGPMSVADYSLRKTPIKKGHQRSFNFLYESWVFVKLMRAFSANGFPMIEAYESLLAKVRDVFMGLNTNDGVVAVAKDEELQVKVIYGVTENEAYSEVPLTPDFAIEITNLRTGRSHVIILDAKVTGSLSSNQSAIDNRDKYLDMVWNDPQRYPDQSWLVYTGPIIVGSNLPAAIEFSPDEDKRMFKRNRGLKWSGQDGILGMTSQSRPVGHLRVNCNMVGTNDVFNEFVAGQLATARRIIATSRA